MTKLNYRKITYLVIGLIFIMAISITIPSLARYKNRVNTEINVWDGTVATNFKSGEGTISSPYIISNGSELAYLSDSLKTNNYEGMYFKISSDIVLNNGKFNYEDNKYIYEIDNNKYYINNDKYYSDTEYTNEVGSLNILSPLEGFKGIFNGDSHIISGLYMYNDESALFKSLNGTIEKLYIKNSLLTGNKAASLVTNSTSSIINEVLFEGFVISNAESKTKKGTISIDTIELNNNKKNITVNIDDSIESYNNISSIKVSGDYNIDTNNGTVLVNDASTTNNHFEITTKTNSFTITASSTEISNVSFENISYEITYNDNMASGIALDVTDTELTNVINKGNIYSNNVSSGLVGILNNSKITNAYNNGVVNTLGGIASYITGKSNLINVYNSYENTSLINIVENSTLNIIGSFNTSNIKPINTVVNSELSIQDSYIVDSTLDTTSNFTMKTIEELKNQETMKTIFHEYVSLEDLDSNIENAWIYESDSYPLLFNDDITNGLATLHIKTYSYDNFSNVLETFNYKDNVSFSIEDKDELNPSDKYYYIHKSKTPLTRSELENILTWNEYNQIETLNGEGYFIVYVKLVNDNKNYYINSDIFTLDKSSPNVTLKLNNNTWNSLNTELNTIDIDDETSFTVEATDSLSGVKSIKYYLSKNILSEPELSSVEWATYDENAKIKDLGKYIIYIKVTDNVSNETIINSDYINYDGYKLTITSGNHLNSNLNITDKSKLKFKFIYDGENKVTGTHSLVSNTLLPDGTIITLNDQNKIYEHIVDSTSNDYGFETNNYATYKFELFKEKNKYENTYYKESENVGTENIEVTLDFKNTSITNDLKNITISLNIGSSRKTLQSNIKEFNVYKNSDASLVLTSTYDNKEIEFNVDSTISIELSSGVKYITKNTSSVIDTTYEDKIQGLAIKLLDSNNNILDKTYLEKLVFTIDGINYTPDSDNIIRIPFSDTSSLTTKSLLITTSKSDLNLTEDNINIEISNYVSYDGKYYDKLNNSIKVPVVITNNNKTTTDYEFSISIPDELRIINKKDENITLDFDIITKNITNPTIKVSLYKKDKLTAYDQTYNIVDLKDYTTSSLTSFTSNVYLTNVNDTFTLDLIPSKFESNGYKFVFDLYSDNVKINTIEKYFIAK